jgi:hypothetical protein
MVLLLTPPQRCAISEMLISPLRPINSSKRVSRSVNPAMRLPAFSADMNNRTRKLISASTISIDFAIGGSLWPLHLVTLPSLCGIG